MIFTFRPLMWIYYKLVYLLHKKFGRFPMVNRNIRLKKDKTVFTDSEPKVTKLECGYFVKMQFMGLPYISIALVC